MRAAMLQWLKGTLPWMWMQRLTSAPAGSAYRTDWPWRISVLPLARLVETPFYWSAGLQHQPIPKLATIGLVVLFVGPGVILANAWASNALTPELADIRPLTRDYVAWGLAVLTPITVATAFDFYLRVFEVFYALERERVISDSTTTSFSDFIKRIDRTLNSLAIQPFLLGFVVFANIMMYRNIRDPGQQAWIAELSIGAQTWLHVAFSLVLFSTLTFAWKCLVVWLEIRKLGTSNGLDLRVREHHPDGCGGLSQLSKLWLRVHFVMVAVGLVVFVGNAWNDTWTNPDAIAGMILYGVFAPILFIGPFFPVHSKMVQYKATRLSKTLQEWERIKEQVQELTAIQGTDPRQLDALVRLSELRRKAYEDTRGLPTWPFSGPILRWFMGSFLVPIVTGALSGFIVQIFGINIDR